MSTPCSLSPGDSHVENDRNQTHSLVAHFSRHVHMDTNRLRPLRNSKRRNQQKHYRSLHPHLLPSLPVLISTNLSVHAEVLFQKYLFGFLAFKGKKTPQSWLSAHLSTVVWPPLRGSRYKWNLLKKKKKKDVTTPSLVCISRFPSGSQPVPWQAESVGSQSPGLLSFKQRLFAWRVFSLSLCVLQSCSSADLWRGVWHKQTPATSNLTSPSWSSPEQPSCGTR